ncbi:hypothetical protein HRbin26_00874 [bacterium HR26]|nr:hypothetical protein HRbin26_00874 [bacterium HR26]
MNYQGIGPRFVATVIDTILIMIPTCVLGFVIGGATGQTTETGFSLQGASAFLYFLLSFLIWLGYYTLFEGLIGATPGKLALKLRVVRIDGRPIGLQEALLRNVLRIVDGIFFYLVAAALVATSPTKQRLGDRVAGTVVIGRTAPVPAQSGGAE